MRIILLLIIVLAAFSGYGQGKTQKKLRKYKTGEREQYEIKCVESFNGKLSSITIAKCELTTIKVNGIFYDEVKWISKLMIKGNDTLVQDDLAKRVASYKISLDNNGSLDIPKIEVPEMTQPIQDFNTFFVAISPHLGNNNLVKPGDYYKVPSQINGNFANGSSILVGNDCFDVDIKYVSDSLRYRKTLVKFAPSKVAGIKYLLSEMTTPIVDGVVNNFQMVMPSGDLFNVQYGVESFSIESMVERKSGILTKATMNNELELKLKMNCNKEFENCSTQMSFQTNRFLIVRKL